MDIGKLERAEIDKFGVVDIRELTEPKEIIPGGYATGPVEKVTDYEKGNPNLLVKRGDRLEQDLFEGNLPCFLLSKTEALLSSAAELTWHYNIVKYVVQISGISKIHAIIGGFHLVNAQSNLIDRYIEDIKGFS
jgi:7,8-dihydropterin-6-yl-methyl-4-(beta-D-ribofuranosyl)aminobenzene 5'-phosphate synthase